MGFEAPRQLSPEEQERIKQEAKLTKGKAISDIEVIEQGAEYVADEDSDSPRLEFTRDQLEAAREEMFGDVVEKKESKIEKLEDTMELLEIALFEMRKTLEGALYAARIYGKPAEEIVQNAIDLAKEGFRVEKERREGPGGEMAYAHRSQAEANYGALSKKREAALDAIAEKLFPRKAA